MASHPAGLTEDEDVRAMLRGSRLCKIRSRTWQKERLYRLQEDGLSVWFQRRIRHAPSQHICESGRVGTGRACNSAWTGTVPGRGHCLAGPPPLTCHVWPSFPAVLVQHIEAVREGHQSEGLRRFGGAFAPACCLTITFKGRRKNLDLAAPTAEEAQRWVRGLTKLRARLDAMSQRERLDQYPTRERGPGAGGFLDVEGGRLWPWRTPGRAEVQLVLRGPTVSARVPCLKNRVRKWAPGSGEPQSHGAHLTAVLMEPEVTCIGEPPEPGTGGSAQPVVPSS